MSDTNNTNDTRDGGAAAASDADSGEVEAFGFDPISGRKLVDVDLQMARANKLVDVDLQMAVPKAPVIDERSPKQLVRR